MEYHKDSTEFPHLKTSLNDYFDDQKDKNGSINRVHVMTQNGRFECGESRLKQCLIETVLARHFGQRQTLSVEHGNDFQSIAVNHPMRVR